MYKSWQDIKKEDTNDYVVGTLGDIRSLTDLEYEATGVIDVGHLFSTIRRYMGYNFLSKDILEFGCGNGRMTRVARPYFNKYFAVDISKTMLSLTKEKVKDIECVESNGSPIALGDKSVDIIFTFTVLMHNRKENIAPIIAEFERIIKPGGFMFIQLPCYTNTYNREKFDEVSIWKRQEIEELSKNLEVLHIADSKEPLGSCISDKHFEYHVFRRVV